jgi:UDP-apiose/xylose synthase
MVVSSADTPRGTAGALPERIAVLGGFLGSPLTEALLNCGAQVVVLDRCFDKLGRDTMDRPRLRCVTGSVDDAALLETAVDGCDVVVSMTALCNPSLYNTVPHDVIRANFLDLLPLVELCLAEMLPEIVDDHVARYRGRAADILAPGVVAP